MSLSWKHPYPAYDDCVLVGCDNNTSWMLNWWYNNYIKYNTLPIMFADFGMYPPQRNWCAERGTVFSVSGTFKCNWFKKPLAILACDYKRILWIDSDCEVKGNVEPIIAYADQPPGFAGVLDPYGYGAKDSINTGVLAIRHGIDLIPTWAERCSGLVKLRGDQEVLGEFITSSSVTLMPPEYNHLRLSMANNDAAMILHWTGNAGKIHIRKMITPPPDLRIIRKQQAKLPTIRPKSVYRPPQILRQSSKLTHRAVAPTPIPISALKKLGIRKPIKPISIR